MSQVQKSIPKIYQLLKPTNALICIVFILKDKLKHLKSSYMFRSNDHHQGAHAHVSFRINTIHISAFVGFNNWWIFRMHGATINIVFKIYPPPEDRLDMPTTTS
jgi:hypothetical protein